MPQWLQLDVGTGELAPGEGTDHDAATTCRAASAPGEP
jgi:hypothetical protein